MRLTLAALAIAAMLLTGAAQPPMTFDFSRYDESQWTPAREDRFPSPGKFVQKDGYILNDFPEGAVEHGLFNSWSGVGYALRLIKDVTAKDGRAEMEVELSGKAAPSIFFRAQMPPAAGPNPAGADTNPTDKPREALVHGPAYNLVIFNHNTEKKESQGVVLWKWQAPEDGRGRGTWAKLAYWYMPIPREKRVKLAVDFKGEAIRVYVDGKEIGGLRDTAALGAGRIGVAASEGACKLYSFTFTPAE